MSIALGVAKQTRWKRQAAKGTIAPAGAGGQILRRQQAIWEVKRDTYDTSSEMNSAQQLSSVQLGVKEIPGSINGLLTPGVYSDFLSSILRRDFAVVAPIAGASITIAGAGPYTVTRAAGSFLTDGIKVGMVVRLGAGAFNAANLNKNLFVTAVTALVLTVLVVNNTALVAEGPIAASSVTAPGKVTFAPAAGHTKIYYTFEEWSPDVPSSEVFQDVRMGSAQITLPGTGNSTIQFSAVGLDSPAPTAAVYYVAPTVEAATDVIAAASGELLVNGSIEAAITNMQFTIDAQAKSADGVVGSNVRPDVFVGKVKVTGQFTAYFDSLPKTNLFLAGSDIAVGGVLPNASTAAADFIAYYMPRLKLTTATPDDNETGLKRTYQFTAEYNVGGGVGIATEQTTLQLQDSLAA